MYCLKVNAIYFTCSFLHMSSNTSQLATPKQLPHLFIEEQEALMYLFFNDEVLSQQLNITFLNY